MFHKTFAFARNIFSCLAFHKTFLSKEFTRYFDVTGKDSIKTLCLDKMTHENTK